jgi:hypothetical protein
MNTLKVREYLRAAVTQSRIIAGLGDSHATIPAGGVDSIGCGTCLLPEHEYKLRFGDAHRYARTLPTPES